MISITTLFLVGCWLLACHVPAGAADLDGALPFRQAWRMFNMWHDALTASGFCTWGGFDMEQLAKDCSRQHMEMLSDTGYVDLSRRFTEKYGRRKGHRAAMEVMGLVPRGRHHRGLDDALNIARMVPCLLEER